MEARLHNGIEIEYGVPYRVTADGREIMRGKVTRIHTLIDRTQHPDGDEEHVLETVHFDNRDVLHMDRTPNARFEVMLVEPEAALVA